MIYVDFRIEIRPCSKLDWKSVDGTKRKRSAATYSVVWAYVSRGASKNRVLSSALSESPPVALKGVKLSRPVCRVEPLVLRQSDPKCKVSDGMEGKSAKDTDDVD